MKVARILDILTFKKDERQWIKDGRRKIADEGREIQKKEARRKMGFWIGNLDKRSERKD